MSIENAKTWIDHPELAGKAIRSFRRTDHEPTGDNYIVIEFEDGTRLELGANDLGTWINEPVHDYAVPPPTERVFREAGLDYALVKSLVEKLPPTDRIRLVNELTEQLPDTPETIRKTDRYAGEFYDIWKGVVFSEEDFKAAEWHLGAEELNGD